LDAAAAVTSRITIICGHYGCGKTNLALNLAAGLAQAGERVTLVDMDIVNPYFRSSDYKPLLDEAGIELLAPTYAHSNVDLPAMPAEMASIFTRKGRIIIDAGGDDAGAIVLGRYSAGLREEGYEMLYVINRCRALSTTAEETTELLHEIEAASRLKATGVVNNTHIMEGTTAETVLASDEYAHSVCEMLGLPLVFTSAERRLTVGLEGKLPNIFPVDILVTKPWQD